MDLLLFSSPLCLPHYAIFILWSSKVKNLGVVGYIKAIILNHKSDVTYTQINAILTKYLYIRILLTAGTALPRLVGAMRGHIARRTRWMPRSIRFVLAFIQIHFTLNHFLHWQKSLWLLWDKPCHNIHFYSMTKIYIN